MSVGERLDLIREDLSGSDLVILDVRWRVSDLVILDVRWRVSDLVLLDVRWRAPQPDKGGLHGYVHEHDTRARWRAA